MKAIVLVVVLTAIRTLPCVAQPPQASIASGVISGTVKGADGSIITSGVAGASRVPDSVSLPKHARTAATVVIGPDGSFHFPPLVEGTYRICTQSPGAWISPCDWGDSAATRISLSAGQASANVRIVLQKGAFVTVRVDDTGQFLATSAPSSSASLLIGVGTDSFVFRKAALLAQDVGGRTYQVLIPFDRSIRIVAASASFHLAQASGSLLAALSGNAIPVLVPSGQQPPIVTLKVTGRTSP